MSFYQMASPPPVIYYLKVFSLPYSQDTILLFLKELSRTKMLYFLTLYAIFKVLNTKIQLGVLDAFGTLVEAKNERIISRFNLVLVTLSQSAKRNLTEPLGSCQGLF